MTQDEIFIKELEIQMKNTHFINEIKQINAKSVLKESHGKNPSIDWKYNAHRMIRNLTLCHFQLKNSITSNSEGNLLNYGLICAQTWESFSNLNENITKLNALLNAAIDYEYAGYQANSRSITKKILNMKKTEISPIIKMICYFLQRKFFYLKQLAEQFQKEPENSLTDDDLVIKMGEALLGRALLDCISYFFSGNESNIMLATESLKKAKEIFAKYGYVEETNIISDFKDLIKLFKTRSIWTILGKYCAQSPKWFRYLKLLARGFGDNLLSSSSVSELWTSQIESLKFGILDKDINYFLKMPTSSGKTRIAEIDIIHTLITHPGSRCVYIAPFRALVSEISKHFFDLLNNLGYRASSIIGSYETDEFQEKLLYLTDLIVTTPEKLDLFFRTKKEYFENVRLIVLDEVHIINDESRGTKFEFLIMRIKKRFPQIHFLFLSAVVSDENLQDFSHWLNKTPNLGVLKSTWRPSLQKYAKLEWNDDRGTLRYFNDDLFIPSFFIPNIIKTNQYIFINQKTGRKNTVVFPNPISKGHIAIELALRFANLGPIYIFCVIPDWVESVAEEFIDRIELMENTDSPLPLWVKKRTDIRSYIIAKEWLSKDHIATKSLLYGIGIHHGRLPEIVKNAIIEDFKQGYLRIIIATNTIAQGVNLPIHTIIIHSCERRDTERNITVPLAARDYWNIAGRAGRAGEETSGQVIHIVRNSRDEKLFQNYLKQRNLFEFKKTDFFSKFIEVFIGRMSPESLLSEIDPEILAILVEEEINTPIIKQFADDYFANSLLEIQASRYSAIDVNVMKNLFIDAANSLLLKIPDSEIRKVYSYTGLKSDSCIFLNKYIESIQDQIKPIFEGIKVFNMKESIDLIILKCLELPEMEISFEFGRLTELLTDWVNNISISEIFDKYKDSLGSIEKLQKIIDDLFGYRLPWGISGFIQIAIKLFNINPKKIPVEIKFLPTIVKYGLPNPAACWAMEIGIPTRKSAVSIASIYLREKKTLDYIEFLNWLSDLNIERIIYDFKIKRPLLDDVINAIHKASVNPLLKKLENIKDIFPINTEIKGIEYENRVVFTHPLQAKDELLLKRDSNNIFDQNAIEVYTINDNLIGFISRKISQIIAIEIDTGLKLKTFISNIDRSKPIPSISMIIDIDDRK